MALYIKYIKIPKKRKKERKETILSADDIEVPSIGMRKGLAAHPQSSSVLSLCTCDLHQLLCLLTTHLLLIPTKIWFSSPSASSITKDLLILHYLLKHLITPSFSLSPSLVSMTLQ